MADQADAERLANVNEALCATVENGPWVLIADPNLRALVGEYVADTCHSVAAAAGLDEAMELAHDAIPTKLATAGWLVSADARERLARHLYLTSVAADWRGSYELLWDRRDDRIDFDAVYAHADELLAVITGKDA